MHLGAGLGSDIINEMCVQETVYRSGFHRDDLNEH